ncbi:MAG: winged helix-turn-helix transcriptional regulator, partial [archaeon]|nr:winged helix-turn-helix transcriptional regulator [archaeon]
TGPLYLQIDSAAKFVIDNVKTNVTIEGLFRKEEPEIPYEAIREVITYAVVHRCYQMSSSPISVGVYDNIVEVISPGLLPDGLTVEEAVSGCRCHRNRALSEFFIAVKMMEGWGSGLRRAFDQCLSHGLAEPELDTVGENIRITIYRRGVKPTVSNGILPLDDFQKAILKVLAENPSLTLPEVAAMLKVSPATVNKAVKALKASDRLSREGSNKKGRWVVHSRI